MIDVRECGRQRVVEDRRGLSEVDAVASRFSSAFLGSHVNFTGSVYLSFDSRAYRIRGLTLALNRSCPTDIDVDGTDARLEYREVDTPILVDE
jgi:hypothetical protein